jgi:glucose-1-phosphate adenylyltransferase
MSDRVLAMVLAGGQGSRLFPLTRDRAKPAVPFGGQYRLIDFVLSNLVNAGYRRVVVLTQYKSHSLDRHLAQTWRLSPLLGNYVASVPAQMRRGPQWFAGSADAIYQNLNLIDDERPDHVLVFGADHIYRMDPRQMLDQHLETGAGVTIAGIPIAIEEASSYGIIDAGSDMKIRRFHEKPEVPPPMPDDPTRAFASMGNYIFDTSVLTDIVREDSEDGESRHDVGGNIIPRLTELGVAFVYDFAKNLVPGQTQRERGYWRDVGTLDSYYDASMDLVAVNPIFDLYNEEWPILTLDFPLPPAKFVHDVHDRRGYALNSLVANGTIISGASVRQSVVSPRVRVHSYASIDSSVLFDGVNVGRGAIVRNAIVDKNVQIPEGFRIGVDREADAARFTMSTNGVVVIGKGDEL